MSEATIGAWNARMAAAPIAEPSRLVGAGGLVVLAPHPDDESIGCAALLIEAGRTKRPVAIVALTDGEGSHRASQLFPPPRLGAIRAGEQRAAVAALGCAHAEWLRLALPDGASGRADDFDAAVEAVAGLCERLGVTALAAPHPDDPHPDHHAAARLALLVRERHPRLRILFYEVWSRRLPADEPFRSDGLVPFRVAVDVTRKREAIQAHASQHGLVVPDDPTGFALPDWFLRAQEEPTERLSWLTMPGAPPGPEHFARLYAGDGDPWHVRSSAYEAEKRAAAVAMLEGRRFERMLEAGCGEGHLTGALLRAGIAAAAIGFDREPAIVERARRMGWGPEAAFHTGAMPDDIPAGRFDLAVLSEVLYFLDEAALGQLARNLADRLVPGAALLVVAYKGPTDTPLAGPDAADLFAAAFGTTISVEAVRDTADYRMERLALR